MKQIDANIPRLIRVNDYHEIDALERSLQMINVNIRVDEVGFRDGEYIGIVYIDDDVREMQAYLASVVEAVDGKRKKQE